MDARGVSIRWSLLRNLLLLVALLAGAILAVMFAFGRRAVRTLSADLLERTADRSEVELNRFFEPVIHLLEISKGWAAEGVFERLDREGSNRLFLPLLRQLPNISSVNTGDAKGNGYLLLHIPGGWRNREVRCEVWDCRAQMTTLSEDGGVIEQHWEELAYDPRVRPWYPEAAADEEGAAVHWTAPYTFFTTKEPGITASVGLKGTDGTPFVLAFDVLLTDVSNYTSALEVSDHGMAFIVDEQGRMIGLPGVAGLQEVDARQAATLKPAAEIGVPVVSEVVRHAAGANAGEAAFAFESGGEKWWAVLRPLRVGDGPALRIGVAVPESDFLGEVHAQRTLVLILTVAALLLAGGIALVLSRRYSRPIDQLVVQSERIRNLDLKGGVVATSRLREMAQLGEAQERMRVALDAFARYVPTEVVRELLDRGEAAQIGGRSRSLTMLFSDIEGFTRISESMSPEALTGHMASYFDALVQVLREGHGTIDKFVGDAIVAFWGAPRPDPDHARNAVASVHRCTQVLDRLNEEWSAAGLPALPTRFGLSTGDVVVGNVGTPSRLSYTVLGDAVNLASRLEGTNREYGTRVLASAATREAAGDGFHWRMVDVLRVKGREEPEAVYELLGPRGEVDADRLAWAARYEEALAHYGAREFSAAVRTLEEAEARRPRDPSVKRLLALARAHEATPPPPDWDPVTRRLTK